MITVSLFLALTLPISANPRESKTEQKLEMQGSLALGKTEGRKLAPGTAHVWDLALDAGKYIYVEVVQKGIDVVIRIVGPDGQSKEEFDSPVGPWGVEKVRWITGVTGRWKLKIVPVVDARPGYYEIRWVTLRLASDRDQKIVEAASLENQAYRYDRQRRYAESEPLHKQSLEIREKALGADHPDVAQSLNN